MKPDDLRLGVRSDPSRPGADIVNIIVVAKLIFF